MKRIVVLLLLCVPLFAQVGRYQLHDSYSEFGDRHRYILLLDTKTGEIYDVIIIEMSYSDEDSIRVIRDLRLRLLITKDDIEMASEPPSSETKASMYMKYKNSTTAPPPPQGQIPDLFQKYNPADSSLIKGKYSLMLDSLRLLLPPGFTVEKHKP